MEVPEKLINFRVYENGGDQVGVADVTLPKLSSMTETVKGAGIAGEVDSPVLGHFKSLEVELNWRTLEKTNLNMTAHTGLHLDLRGAQQVYDSGTGKYVVRPVKCVIAGVTKETDMGKFDVGQTTGTKTTVEAAYIKVDVDGENVLEIDKFNYICKVGGTDWLAAVRSALGIG